MRKLSMFTLACICISSTVLAQEILPAKPDRDWKVEVEPAFALNGFGIQLHRNITADNRMSLGLYSTALDIPETYVKGIFKNVPNAADTRVTLEVAAVFRYKFEVFKGLSNPYIGFIGGWEGFSVQQANKSDVEINTLLATPYIGHEIYVFGDRIYLNPQIRGVFYVNPTVKGATQGETLNTLFVLPTFSAGFRF